MAQIWALFVPIVPQGPGIHTPSIQHVAFKQVWGAGKMLARIKKAYFAIHSNKGTKCYRNAYNFCIKMHINTDRFHHLSNPPKEKVKRMIYYRSSSNPPEDGGINYRGAVFIRLRSSSFRAVTCDRIFIQCRAPFR